MRQEKVDNRVTFKDGIKIMLSSLIISLAVLVILAAIVSLIFYLFLVADNLQRIIGFIILGITALISGILSADSIGKKGLIIGIISGLLLFLVLYLSRNLLNGNYLTFKESMVYLFITLICGGVGGIIAVNKK